MQNWWAKVESDGSEKYYRPSVPVYAHVFKTTRPTFQGNNAFVAKVKNENGPDHVSIFQRKEDDERLPIVEKKGLSVPQMLNNSEVRQELEQQTVDKFNDEIERAITDILMGRR